MTRETELEKGSFHDENLKDKLEPKEKTMAFRAAVVLFYLVFTVPFQIVRMAAAVADPVSPPISPKAWFIRSPIEA